MILSLKLFKHIDKNNTVATLKKLLTLSASVLIGGCYFVHAPEQSSYSRFGLYSRISKKEHCNRKIQRTVIETVENGKQVFYGTKTDEPYTSEDASQVYNLSQKEFNLVSVIQDFFEDNKNLPRIAKDLEECVQQKKEIGGYAKLSNGLVKLIEDSTPIGEDAVQINIPLFEEIIALYHYHATKEDCSDFAGPSNNDFIHHANKGIPGIVITKLKGRKFNVDVYFGSKPPIVIDLGNYEY